jgi:hypothetical protein
MESSMRFEKARELPYESTTEQLRADIDSGRTGDKVPGLDPAAAPLGTDEEAAGTPVRGGAVTAARINERSRELHQPQVGRGLGSTWILIAFVLLLAVGIFSWVLLR